MQHDIKNIYNHLKLLIMKNKIRIIIFTFFTFLTCKASDIPIKGFEKINDIYIKVQIS